MQLAIYLISNSLLHTKIFDTGFLPGVDDWDFTPEATSTWDQTNSDGAAVTERYYFVNQKATSGPLFGRFDIAKGVPSSNVSGMRWSATVAAEFDTLVQPFLAEAVQDRAANPAQYDRVTVQWIAASIFASNGRPQILAFDDVAKRLYQTVLARSWDGPAGILHHANPLFPGDLTKSSTWTSNGYVCTPTCFVVVKGLNHLIQYAAELSGPGLPSWIIRSARAWGRPHTSNRGPPYGSRPSTKFRTRCSWSATPRGSGASAPRA